MSDNPYEPPQTRESSEAPELKPHSDSKSIMIALFSLSLFVLAAVSEKRTTYEQVLAGLAATVSVIALAASFIKWRKR